MRKRSAPCEHRPWVSCVRPHWRFLRFLSVPGICRSDRGRTCTDLPFARTGIPPGRPNRSTEAERSFILACTFDRTPSFFTRCDRFLVNVNVLQPTSVNIDANLGPGGNHRSWQFVDPRRLVPVKLSGESCVVNRGRPILWIFVEAGYPHLVDRHLNRLMVSFAV